MSKTRLQLASELVEKVIIGAGSNIVLKGLHAAAGWARGKFHYTKHYKSKVKKVQVSLEGLLALVRDETERPHIGMVLTCGAEICIREVNNLEKEVEDMVNACENIRWFNRVKLGEEADKTISKIENLKNRWSGLSEIYCSAPQTYISSALGEFTEYGSTRETIDKVIISLKDENKHIISVFGTGGVGKSTLRHQIGLRIEAEKVFDVVMGVELPTNPTPGKIQELIADGLRLVFSSSTVEQRSRELATRLSDLNVLIMLDNVWTEPDFSEIGIPFGRNCKVLLSTRIFKVCPRINEHIPINFLTEEDSFDLFRRNSGLDELSRIQEEVAKECSGLPLALVVVGNELDGHDEASWRCALRELRLSKPVYFPNVEEKLFRCLELSYDQLNHNDWKRLFLLCSLFPEGHIISEDELTWYGIGTDILGTYNNLEILRENMHVLVAKLKHCCLLLSTNKPEAVTMHDVVRHVAINIASRTENKFFIGSCSNKDDCTECIMETASYEEISIISDRISHLPTIPIYEQLQVLLLRQNRTLRDGPVMSDIFFNQMTELTVLDLSDTLISRLPSSIDKLGNLRVLLLNGCKNLSRLLIPITWKELEILSMRGCSITSLPMEIKELVSLKLLDLSYILNLTIPPQLLCCIQSLEELYLDSSSISAEILIDITCLSRLARLQLHVKDATIFSHNISNAGTWKRLKSYDIYSEQSVIQYVTPYKKVSIKRVDQFADWVKVLFSQTEDLILDRCFMETPPLRLVKLDKEQEFRHLKILHLIKCDQISHLLWSEDGNPVHGFISLEVLHIFGLENFMAITEGEISDTSFTNIKEIHVIGCKNIKMLMPCCLLVRVHKKLEELDVINCHMLGGVFCFSDNNTSSPMFLKLKTIKLHELPVITTIYQGVVPQESFKSLKQIDIQGCHNLEYVLLSSMCSGLKCLEKLVVANNRKMQQIIKHDQPLDEDTFQKLTDLEITDMDWLEQFYNVEEEWKRFSWPLLERIYLGSCWALRSLPIGVDNAPELNNIKLRENGDLHWFNTLWEDENTPLRFPILYASD